METLIMSKRERARLEVFGRVAAADISLVKASELLSLSYRQTKRLWSGYLSEGDTALVHGLRGRPSNRQPDLDRKQRVLSAYAASYSDYGPTLASECLQQEEGLEVHPETLRLWLREAGLWTQARRRKQHRRRRPRREHRGELVQMDGSHHDWFEGRRSWAVLMVLVDDATNFVSAEFHESESLSAAFSAFRGWLVSEGIPRSAYVDQHSIYREARARKPQEIVDGKEPATQFGRSMVELHVELILARSAQAKGRVERMNGTLQDRLVKALRREKISDLCSANAYLRERFLLAFNRRFSKPAAKEQDVHRPVPAELDLDRVFSFQETRIVQNDWTIRWRNQFFQLGERSGVSPKTELTVCEQMDGEVRLFANDRELEYSTTRTHGPSRKRKQKRREEIKSNQGQKPSADHPWRGKPR